MMPKRQRGKKRGIDCCAKWIFAYNEVCVSVDMSCLSLASLVFFLMDCDVFVTYIRDSFCGSLWSFYPTSWENDWREVTSVFHSGF